MNWFEEISKEHQSKKLAIADEKAREKQKLDKGRQRKISTVEREYNRKVERLGLRYIGLEIKEEESFVARGAGLLMEHLERDYNVLQERSDLSLPDNQAVEMTRRFVKTLGERITEEPEAELVTNLLIATGIIS